MFCDIVGLFIIFIYFSSWLILYSLVRQGLDICSKSRDERIPQEWGSTLKISANCLPELFLRWIFFSFFINKAYIQLLEEKKISYSSILLPVTLYWRLTIMATIFWDFEISVGLFNTRIFVSEIVVTLIFFSQSHF